MISMLHGCRPTRGTFLHDFQDLDLSDDTGGICDAYDIDTDIATIYANATDQARIPSDRFSQMSATGKQLWQNMTEADRRLILDMDSLSMPSSLTDSQSEKTRSSDSSRGHGTPG